MHKSGQNLADRQTYRHLEENTFWWEKWTCTKNSRGKFLENNKGCFVNKTSLGTELLDLVFGWTGGGWVVGGWGGD